MWGGSHCTKGKSNMSPARLKFFQVSLAAAGLCMWVHAMDQYADIFEEVKPRMDKVEVRTGIAPRSEHIRSIIPPLR